MLRPHQKLYAAAFTQDGAFVLATVAMPFYIYDVLGGDASLSGIIGGLTSLFYAIACFISARYIERLRQANLVMAGATLFYGILVVAAFMQRSVPLFSAAIILSFLGPALFWPAMHSWFGGEPDPSLRTQRMGRLNLFWSGGIVMFSPLAGELYTYHHFAPAMGAVLLCGVTAWLAIRVPLDAHHYGEVSAAQRESRSRHDREGERHLLSAWIGTATGLAIMGILGYVFPKHLATLVDAGTLTFWGKTGLPAVLAGNAPTAFAVLFCIAALGRTVTFGIMGRYHGWHHRFVVPATAQVAAGLALWSLVLTHNYLLMCVACAVIGMANGTTFFAGVYYSMVDPTKKHQRCAINEAAVGMGSFLGPVALGLAAWKFSLEQLFSVMPVIIGALVVVQWACLRSLSARAPEGN